MVVIKERMLERHFSHTCKQMRVLTLKLNVVGQRGWPDRVVILPNRQVFWVELKTVVGRVSPMQQHIHEQLRDAGHIVLVLRTKEEITDALLGTA